MGHHSLVDGLYLVGSVGGHDLSKNGEVEDGRGEPARATPLHVAGHAVVAPLLHHAGHHVQVVDGRVQTCRQKRFNESPVTYLNNTGCANFPNMGSNWSPTSGSQHRGVFM